MVRRAFFSIGFLLAASACLTVSDLEERFAFEACPADCSPDAEGNCVCEAAPDCSDGEVCCAEGTQPTADGRCVPEPDGSNSMPTDANCDEPDEICCAADADGCCEQVDGSVAPCDSSNDGNQDPVSLSKVALVIADASVECQPGAINGPDIYGVFAERDAGELFELLVHSFEPGEGASGDTADALQVVLDSGMNASMEVACPTGESFSLGCRGRVTITFAETAELDASGSLTIRIFESGPFCDDAEDSYTLLACDIQALGAGPVLNEGCIEVAEAVQGNFEMTISSNTVRALF